MKAIAATYDPAAKSATITAFGESRTFSKVWAYHPDHVIVCNVFACKFKTGAKFWSGEATLWLNDDGSVRSVNVRAGYDKIGKTAPIIVGWYDSSNDKHNSKVG